MPATTKAQTAKDAAAETFTDAQGGDPGQLAQVLTTVSDLAARQVALESAHITGTFCKRILILAFSNH